VAKACGGANLTRGEVLVAGLGELLMAGLGEVLVAGLGERVGAERVGRDGSTTDSIVKYGELLCG
jgi:hypothetical protein